MRTSRDNRTNYALIKFKDEKVAMALTKEQHLIDGRKCELKFDNRRRGYMGGYMGAGGISRSIIEQHYQDQTSVRLWALLILLNF